MKKGIALFSILALMVVGLGVGLTCYEAGAQDPQTAEITVTVHQFAAFTLESDTTDLSINTGDFASGEESLGTITLTYADNRTAGTSKIFMSYYHSSASAEWNTFITNTGGPDVSLNGGGQVAVGSGDMTAAASATNGEALITVNAGTSTTADIEFIFDHDAWLAESFADGDYTGGINFWLGHLT